MCPFRKPDSLAEQYDQTLHYTRDARLPDGFPKPAPTDQWPKENIELYERYRVWLLSGGASEAATKTIYLPVAGHALGLNLKPHAEIDLESDLERVLDYTRAKGCGADWLKASRNGLEKFRRFLRVERGLGETSKARPFDVAAYTAGLPAWLLSELERQQRIQQRNWRAARLDRSIRGFWNKHTRLWRFLVEQRAVGQLADVKRQHVLDYIDQRLAAGRSVSSVNAELRYFHTFLLFLQDEGYPVPQALLRIPGLKQPDTLPKYMTDEQVKALRDEIERRAREADLHSYKRQALLIRAAFYLLWQSGLRLGEVEELRLEDLDFPARKLIVRDGKNRKDRAVYLSDTVIRALQDYLPMRGAGVSDHVFLYRNAPLKKDILRDQLKYAGARVGVHVYPHRLRHTCATQLLNAGCRVTSIQAFLGHKKLNTTMIYARAHDQTVADDYFNAMQRVEQRMDITPAPIQEPQKKDEIVKEPEYTHVFAWLEQLTQPELHQKERLEIVAQLRQALGWVEVPANADCFEAQVSEHPPPLA